MSIVLTYRGGAITSQDVVFIRELIAAHPRECRTGLSRLLCQAWNWRQPNGQLKDMVCRGLLLRLHREAHIVLPASRMSRADNFNTHRIPAPVTVDTTPVRTSLKALAAVLELRQVRRTSAELMFNSLIEQYHYLGANGNKKSFNNFR